MQVTIKIIYKSWSVFYTLAGLSLVDTSLSEENVWKCVVDVFAVSKFM